MFPQLLIICKTIMSNVHCEPLVGGMIIELSRHFSCCLYSSKETPPLANLPRQWVIQQLCAMTTMVSMATDSAWQLKILQFLFLNSFFKVVEPTEAVPHVSVVLSYCLSSPVCCHINLSYFVRQSTLEISN